MKALTLIMLGLWLGGEIVLKSVSLLLSLVLFVTFTHADDALVEVDDIAPFVVENAPLDAEKERELNALIAQLDDDIPDIRENATDKLIKLSKSNYNVYRFLCQMLPKGLTLEQEHRLYRIRIIGAPQVSWEQARWELYRNARESKFTQTMHRALESIFEDLTNADRLLLNKLQDERLAELKKLKAKKPDPYDDAEEFQEPPLEDGTRLLDKEIAIFLKGATGRSGFVGKRKSINEVVEALDLEGELGFYRIYFHVDEPLYYITVYDQAEIPLVLDFASVFPEGLRFPNKKPAESIPSLIYCPRIRFSWNGEFAFYLQLREGTLMRAKDPLFAAGQVLETHFPQDYDAINRVQLSET